MADSNPIIPVLAPFPATLALLQERLEQLGYLDLEATTPELAKTLEFPLDPLVALVPLSSRSSLEEVSRVVSVFRARFPDAQILAILSGKAPFSSGEVLSAGATAFFRFPFEEEIFINKIFEHSPVDAATKELTFDQLMRVSIAELERSKTFPFDIYLFLPMNRRAVLYVQSGRPIDEKTVRKFRENEHFNLYVKRSQIRNFLQYSSEFAAPEASSAGKVEFAKETAIKLGSLMGDFFSDETLSEDECRMVLENLKSVSARIESQTATNGFSEMSERVAKFASGHLTQLSHAQNVSAYCHLFGTALGIGDPETLRMGGLLHDIGLSDVPSHLIGLDIEEMDTEDASIYKLHPANGIKAIEERKIEVPSGVLEMILHHHERPDGSGYPNGKRAEEIPPLAKVCGFADVFDKLSSVRPGRRQLSPHEAMRRIAGLDGKPAHPVYEAAFHKPLVDLFMSQPEKGTDSTNKTLGRKSGRPSTAPQRNVGKVRVDDQIVVKSAKANGISIEEMLRQPRYRLVVDDAAISAASDPASQVLLQDLRSQLKSHWVMNQRG